jgi:hypothetical protein
MKAARKTVVILCALSAVSACTDGRVNEPLVPEMPTVVSYSLLAPERIRLLRRAPGQPAEMSVTRRIDARGGLLSVGGALLYIPPGALAAPVEITLSVPKGDEVRADFAPHGLQFRRPALLAFSLAGSGFEAGRASQDLIGAYFQGEPTDGVVSSREVNPAFQYGRMAAFQIWHFCSYGLAPKKGLILVGG